jgi:hypothetical protein
VRWVLIEPPDVQVVEHGGEVTTSKFILRSLLSEDRVHQLGRQSFMVIAESERPEEGAGLAFDLACPFGVLAGSLLGLTP